MDASNGKITFIGHATLLIQLGNSCFLTDPNFSGRIWPLHQRQHRPGLAPDALPLPDTILVSHANYDHLDVFSYKYFPTRVPILVPKGLGKFVRKFLPNPVTELLPGGTHQEGDCKIHAVPTLKRGKRWVPIRYTRSTAYLIESPFGCVYFPGNTGYGPHFKETGGRFRIDVACLPIQPQPGQATGPRSSLNPAKALQACEDLGARWLIPIRWDAFRFGKSRGEDLISELRDLAKKNNLENRLKILKPGQSMTFSREERQSPVSKAPAPYRTRTSDAAKAALKPVDGSKGQC